MEHCAPHRLRVADERRKGEDPRAARAEDRRWGQTEAREQRGRVIGLLLRRGRVPARGLGALPVAAAVVRDDGELVGQEVREPPKNAPIAAGTHNQEKRRPIAPQLVGELCLIRPLEWHESRSHDCVCAERAYPFSAAARSRQTRSERAPAGLRAFASRLTGRAAVSDARSALYRTHWRATRIAPP